jgi:predicted MFS family arabinose efflux permease
MPVTTRKTFRGQLSIFKRPVFLWTAVLCFFMVASAFCLYSYIAEYLDEEKKMSGQMISIMLFVFGAMGIAGNWLAGKTAGKNLFLTCMASLLSVLVVAAGFWFSGLQLFSNIAVIAVWGILFSFGPLVLTSYINRAVPDAMEFGFAMSGTFIGIGISAGVYVGGLMIVKKGVSLAPWSGTGFCIAAILTLFMIEWLERKNKRLIIQG